LPASAARLLFNLLSAGLNAKVDSDSENNLKKQNIFVTEATKITFYLLKYGFTACTTYKQTWRPYPDRNIKDDISQRKRASFSLQKGIFCVAKDALLQHIDYQ